MARVTYDNCNNCNNSNILEKLTKGRANETLPETMNSAASYIMYVTLVAKLKGKATILSFNRLLSLY